MASNDIIYRFVKGQGWVPGYEVTWEYLELESDFYQRELERIQQSYFSGAEHLYGIPSTRGRGRGANFGVPYYTPMQQIPRESRGMRTWADYFANEELPVFLHDAVWDNPAPETTPSDADALIYMYDTMYGRRNP